MKDIRVWAIALFAGVVVAVAPEFLPTGPSTQLDAAALFERGQLGVGLAVTLLAGLLTALTPCVYPLIPITVSVFGAQKAESRGRALLLTSAYVVGMGVVFSTLGVVVAKSGQVFGSLLGNPFVVAGLAVFLLVLASSMFGAFDIQLPASLAQKLNGVGGAGVLGAFLMGSVSGLLTAPCTGPVLTGLLALVAKSQNTLVGASLLFVYALGIGVPFFLIGVFTIRLPRGGAWMEWVKSLFGIALVALAVSYLKDAFPFARDAVATFASQFGRLPGAALAGLVVLVGVLFGALHRSFKEDAKQFALKSAGVLLVVGALVLRQGALNAAPEGALLVRLGLQRIPERPELHWALQVPTDTAPLRALDDALARAKASGRPVMIGFYADWCAACKELDRHTYVDPDVVAASKRFDNIKVDGTNEDDALNALYEKFGVQGLPTVAFVSPTGELLKSPRVTGYLEPKAFLAELAKVR